MALPGISSRLSGARLLLATLLLCPAVVFAQEQVTSPPVDEPEVKTPSPGDAGTALREVERLVSSLEQARLAGDLGERLDSAGQRFSEEVAERLQGTPIDQIDRGRLDSFRRLLPRYRSTLADFQSELNDAIAVTDSAQESLRQAESTWTAIRRNTDREDLPPELANLIERVITEAAKGRQLASERLGGLVAIETRALALRSRIDSLEAEAESRERALLADIFRRDAQPAWTALANLDDGSVGPGLSAAYELVVLGLRDLANTHGSRLVAHASVGLVLLIALLVLGRSSAVTSRIGDGSARRVLDHPVATAIVLTLAFTQPLYPTAQPSVISVNAAVFICAELIVLTAVLGNVRWWSMSLVGAYLIGMAAIYLLPFDTPLQRLALVAGALGGIVLMVATRRFAKERIRDPRWRAAVDSLLLLFGFLLATAVAANIFGAVAYASFVVEAVIRCYMAALGLLTLSIVTRDFIDIALDSRLVGFLRSVKQSQASISVLLKKTITAAAVIFWCWSALNAFRLLDDVLEGATAALNASWTVGQVTVSVGTFVVFVLSIWLAVYVSRITRFFLDEDVLPRLDLPRGVPAAISTGTHYVIIAGALLFGTAAAGLDLTKLAIVVGALSVGIGFGLQNIVNNFVSGIILLLERPIQIGDHVQVGQLMGRVARIGIRASTVRTYEGSEVIVPNGDLISQQVVNNTLSDRDRRLEVLIGVAYGTDLENARDVIGEAVNGVSLVSSYPESMVLFNGFGDSSLDFRVLFWVDDFDVGLAAKSEVGIAINQALAREGIQIPFPQRDVHLYNPLQAGAEPAASD